MDRNQTDVAQPAEDMSEKMPSSDDTLNAAKSVLFNMLNNKPKTHIPYIVTKTTNNEGETVSEEITSLEDHLEHPVRKRANRHFSRADSFIDYVNLHKINGRTSINIQDGNQLIIHANIDDHEVGANGQAGWRQHSARYSPETSRELGTWLGKDGSQMKQVSFALFIETNLLDIAQPAGAELLEIVKTLESKKNVNFKSGVRLDNGDVCLNYEETTESKAGEKGQFSIPPTITMAIPIYKGGNPYQIEANFRYRIEGGHLTMWYELVRIHTIIEHAQNVIVEQVVKGIGGVPVYYGSY